MSLAWRRVGDLLLGVHVLARNNQGEMLVGEIDWIAAKGGIVCISKDGNLLRDLTYCIPLEELRDLPDEKEPLARYY